MVLRFYFAYTVLLGQHRICTVSFTDPEGISHAVEVTAATLYEAAVLAVSEFRRVGLFEVTSDRGRGSGWGRSSRKPCTSSSSENCRSGSKAGPEARTSRRRRPHDPQASTTGIDSGRPRLHHYCWAAGPWALPRRSTSCRNAMPRASGPSAITTAAISNSPAARYPMD